MPRKDKTSRIKSYIALIILIIVAFITTYLLSGINKSTNLSNYGEAQVPKNTNSMQNQYAEVLYNTKTKLIERVMYRNLTELEDIQSSTASKLSIPFEYNEKFLTPLSLNELDVISEDGTTKDIKGVVNSSNYIKVLYRLNTDMNSKDILFKDAKTDYSTYSLVQDVSSQYTSEVIYSGGKSPNEAYDIVLVAAGFEDSMANYKSAADSVKSAILSGSFFSENKDKLNIIRVDNTDSLAGMGCYMEGRFLKCNAGAAMKGSGDNHIVIANMSGVSGTAIRGGGVAFITKGASGVVVHEMGHSLGGLMDEYVHVGYENQQIPYDGINCKQSCDRFNTKYTNGTCYKGCAYGLAYRATSSSIMRTNGGQFDKLGKETMQSAFNRYAPPGSVNPPPSSGDTSPPVVKILSPQEASKLSGIVTINTTATDSSGLQSHNILIDNTNIKSCNTSTSCSYSLDTKKYSNGSHTLKASAIDKKNNSSSTSINITIDNTTTPPPIDPPTNSGTSIIISPSNYSEVSAPLTLTWTKTENATHDLYVGTYTASSSLTKVTGLKDTTYTISTLPANLKGKFIYVRLFTKIGSKSTYKDYVFIVN